MALSIKSSEADQLARQLAELSGQSITEAVTEAIRSRLQEIRHGRSGMRARLLSIAAQGRELPRIDSRSEAEILGYDESGLPR